MPETRGVEGDGKDMGKKRILIAFHFHHLSRQKISLKGEEKVHNCFSFPEVLFALSFTADSPTRPKDAKRFEKI